MTNITKPNAHELQKWRAQALKAAAHLKAGATPKPGEDFIKAGFVFDDEHVLMRVVTLDIPLTTIASMSQVELAQHIYDGVLQKAQEHTPSQGNA